MNGRRVLCASALIAALATALDARLAAQSPPAFRADTWLVVLHAVATTNHGALAHDLDQRAVTVYENGKAQPIKVFRKEDVPVSLGLLIDNSGSMRSLRATVLEASRAFVAASNADDEIFVMNFADTPRLAVPLTTDARAMEAGLAGIDSAGGTAVRDAILAAEAYLRTNATRDRKVLLLITDGNDNASKATTADLMNTIDQALDTSVFAVGLVRAESQGRIEHGHDLEDIVERTGGSLVWARSEDEIPAIVVDLARAIRQQYTIAYTPLNQALDGSYRTVRVKVARSGPVSLRTRTGYLATRAAAR
jgi:Ca-activated chloride channel homolog